ncbi:MAG TPA: ATP-binding protein, partial [Spirochaetia bacterium]|nr:ATP-binding protein [Spirochaetia bacterium]
FARVMGYQTSEELVMALSGGSIQRLYHHPEERSSIIEATLENPEWRPYEWEFMRRDGSVGYGRMMLRSYLPAGASRKVIEAFMEDLTEQKAAERELSRERRLLRMLMEIVPDRIYFKDRAGHYLLANNAFAAAGGFASARALIGIVDSDLYDSVYAKEVRSEQMNILESGVPVLNKERQERWRGGASRWVAVTELPFRDEEEEISGTVGISRDITRQREMQQSITKAQRLESIALFATGVAHHFNNINFVIQGYLQMAISNSEVPDEVRGRLSTALEAVERAVDISRKMELLAHDPSTIREPVDLAELISGIVDVFLRRNEDAAIVMRREIASVPRVAADRSAVEFVVTSLLSNALHATLDAPLREVTIRTLSAPERSGFEVSDNGCGISSEELPKVFTPFYTTKGEWARVTTGLSKVRGMGLSLAVSRSALYAYNGIIELDSRLGEGATATVWLPLFDPSEGPPRNE